MNADVFLVYISTLNCLFLCVQISQNVKTVVINCMAFRTAQKIYQRVASEIGTLSKAIKSFRNASEYIEEKIVEDGPMM